MSPVWTLAGRNRVLRFLAGGDSLPAIAFAAPDAPQWSRTTTVDLQWQGTAFRLEDARSAIVSGVAAAEPFGVELEVGDAEIFGFGAATGAADRNRSRFKVMTRDTLLYGIPGASYTAMPFFIARRGARCTGVLVATPYPLDVAVAEGKVTVTCPVATDGAPLDLIVFRGTGAEIVSDLATLTGRSFLPPAWALGFHQSRWSYATEKQVLEVARAFRNLELPADAVYLDIDHMDRFRVFTFSPERFPDPRRMHDEMRHLGFRTVAIVDPGVSVAPYPVYETLRAGDMLLKRRDGRPLVGRVWPGNTVFPDFLQPRVRETWARFHDSLLAAGVSGIWNDMNEPVFRAGKVEDPLTEDAWHGEVPHRRVRNLYANCMAEATVAGLEAYRPGLRPFVLSRAGSLGIQRHAAVWTGDNHSSWNHLRENLEMVVNLGLSGVPLTGADIGGFGRGPGKIGLLKPRRPAAELFVRWMELGSLMPFFRVHCTRLAPRQEPWSFGRRALDLSRILLRRRYRWLPVLYRLALEAHESGLPIVRPLWMHYETPRGRGGGQFLLGRDVLVAPVLEAGATHRDVWLPEGQWVSWQTGEVVAGRCNRTVAAPLGRTPIFVRAGAALVHAEPGRNADATLANPLALEIRPSVPGIPGNGSLFLDGGASAMGGRFILDVTVEPFGTSARVTLVRRESGFQPRQREVELRVPTRYGTAWVDGETRVLEPRDLSEDRSVRVKVCALPFSASEVVLE